MESFFSKYLFPLGISIDPEQAVIGYDGWIFLGDRHEKTQSFAREGYTQKHAHTVENISQSIRAWDDWLRNHGVQDFKVIIGSNKSSIYPEFTPLWARPADYLLVDALSQHLDNTTIIDTKSNLLTSKELHDKPLYYKSDTHWNRFGAGIAFKQFAEQLKIDHPHLIIPNNEYYNVARECIRNGGDLANFLRISHTVKDLEIITKVYDIKNTVNVYDYGNDTLVSVMGNQVHGAPQKAQLLKSEASLNKAKVLWISDSFGTSMNPYMTTMFSDIVKIHASTGMFTDAFADIVKEWRPDFVFITRVERSIIGPEFQKQAPAISST